MEDAIVQNTSMPEFIALVSNQWIYITSYISLALLVVGIFLALVWFMLQPQPFFLHIIIFTCGVTLLALFSMLPGAIKGAVQAQTGPLLYTPIFYQSILLAWLATAPQNYAKPRQYQTSFDVLFLRLPWIAASALILALVLTVDFYGLQFFFPRHRLILWGIPAFISSLILIFLAFKYFRAARQEAVLFLLTFSLFGWASFLKMTGKPEQTLILTALGSALLITHTLLYHRRFVGLEAELRTGLYDENQSLREENVHQRTVLRLTREAVLQLSRDEQILFANEAFAQLTGYNLAELKGRTLKDVVSRSFYEEGVPALKAAKAGKIENFEIVIHQRQGKNVAVNVEAKPIFDDRRRVNRLHLGFIDLTEAIKKREDLVARIRHQDQDLNLYRDALEKMDDAVILTDRNRRILFASASFMRMTGYAAQDIVGRSTSIYRHETILEDAAVAELQQGTNWAGTWKNKRKDGSLFTVDIFAAPLLQESGDLQYIIWVEHDAGARLAKEAEVEKAHQNMASLRQSLVGAQKESAAIFAALETGIILVRPDGACRFLNQYPVKLLGFSADTLSLNNLPMFVKDLLKMGANYGSKIKSEAVSYTDEFLRPDGEKKMLQWRALPVSADGNRQLGVVIQVIDQTEYQHMQTQVQSLETELSTLQERPSEEPEMKHEELLQFFQFLQGVHEQATFTHAMRRLTKAVQFVGWHSILAYKYGKDSRKYSLVAAVGHGRKQLEELGELDASSVEQYFQSRYVEKSGFLLAPETNRDAWEFWSGAAEMPTGSGRKAKAFYLLPIHIKAKKVGLFICALSEKERLLTDTKIAQLEHIGKIAANLLQNELQKEKAQCKKRQDLFLLELGKIEAIEMNVQKLAESIAAKISEIVNGDVVLLSTVEGVFASACLKESRQSIKIGKDLLNRILPVVSTCIELDESCTLVEDARLGAFSHIFDLKSAPETKQAILAPLRVRKKNIGFIACHVSRESVNKQLLDFIQEATHRIALLIESASFFEHIEGKAEELEQANKYISEFLANVSHELRTPLHTILSYVELLTTHTGLGMEIKNQHLHTIRKSGNRLLHLINDLLDLSKIEAGRMEAEKTPFDLKEFIEEIGNEMASLCHEKKQRLKISIQKELPPQIQTDRNMLARILTNLTRNAQKFTDEGGDVEIITDMATRDRLVVKVIDTGIGIAAKNLKSIFEPFHQIDRKASRKYEGTGLGLPISKRLSELLGGTLEVESRLKKGSTFTLSIPVESVSSPRLKPAEKVQPKKRKGKVTKRVRQLLVVDDDESTREAMRFLLENEGYGVEFASDGITAISLAQHMHPDLILLDIMMPEMDGYQVIRTLKAQKRLKHIPVIALTARAMAEDKARAMQAGFNDFLTKPFSMKDFFKLIREHLE